MSCCNICLKKFGFFTKELGCPICKYTFCKKCLSYEILDPKNESSKKKINVCLKCFHQKNKAPDNNDKKNLDLLKIDEMEQEKLPPPVIDQVLQPAITSSNVENLDNLDDEMVNRLKALKTDREHSVEDDNNDQNIESRLANLKGVPVKDYSKKILFEKDNRTETEQTNELLTQFLGETQIDTTIKKEQDDAISDIERRLALLRDQDVETTKKQIEQNEETEEEETDRIMKQYVEEAKIDDILDPMEKEYLDSIPKNPASNLEELPFCEICNEDATIRCKDCDGDLFCNACFKEFHYEEDYRNHKTVPYKAPKDSQDI